MSSNTQLIRSAPTTAWLSQFKFEDQADAIILLEAVRTVSRDAFIEGLRALILKRAALVSGPIGLYAERELKHRNRVPHRLFKQTNKKPRTAFGVGPRPVEPTQNFDAEVGSEGLVAQLITELCRESPTKFLNHPGPDTIRKRRMRKFMLITDLVGSGQRVSRYLEAAWRVASVRSWWSARATTGFGFEIIAYAATDEGRAVVQRHASSPELHVVALCPTVDNSFDKDTRFRIRTLCIYYDPLDHDVSDSLGYGGTGALIVFAHGAPNNCPRILHKSSARWQPLFRARVTSATRSTFSESLDAAEVRRRLLKLGQVRLARAQNWARKPTFVSKFYLALAALSRPPRTREVAARRTGFTLLELDDVVTEAQKHGWLDDHLRLTDSGQRELAHARKARSRTRPSGTVSFDQMYYPTALRAPGDA